MTKIAEKLDERLNIWDRDTARQVEKLVSEIIELADVDALEALRSRQVEQEVLDIIDAED